MQIRSIRWMACLLPALVLLGCPKKGGDATDAGTDATSDEAAAPTTTATPATPAAKNVGSVARFPDETKLGGEVEKSVSASTARTAPKSGSVVAQLKAGTELTKLAEHEDSVLVTFADPKDATSLLLGWVGKVDAFTADAIVDAGATDGGNKDGGAKDAGADGGPRDAGADAGKAAVKCAAGQEAVVLGASREPVCKKKCTKDTECKTGAAGACAVAATGAGKAVRVCVAD